jgi:glycosyltransferase involved in cell wall biosynthesis
VIAPVRVLHVIPAVAARYGGPSAAIVPMCEAVRALGVEPTIVTTDADGPERLPVESRTPTLWRGIPAIFFKRNLTESFKYSRALRPWLDDNVVRFDVVHIHGLLSHACFAAAAACDRRRVPYIVRPLGTLAPWSLRQKSVRKRLLLAVGGTAILRRAAAVHYTSPEEKRTVETAFGLAGGVVIPLGIDAALVDEPPLDHAERERDRYVLALSRIHPKKNLEALLDAFIALTAGGRAVDWRLVIAGTGESAYVNALQQRARAAKADGRVTFVGWVDGDRKHDLIRRASIFALCSKHENFGVAVLEALAAGVPALLSRHVDLAADVQGADAGWIVDDGDESILEPLARACGNPRERESKGQVARDLARRFVWPAVAGELRQLYLSVTAHGTQHPVRLHAAPVTHPAP